MNETTWWKQDSELIEGLIFEINGEYFGVGTFFKIEFKWLIQFQRISIVNFCYELKLAGLVAMDYKM